jgi:hypothetical protein
MRDKLQPWRETSRTIGNFPRCRAYLKAMGVRIDDPSQTDYWLAVSLSDAFSDKALAKQGISFDTMQGKTLLTAFEAILADRAKPKSLKAKSTPLDKITAAVSEAEIIAAMSPKGGWKAKTLSAWGVPWPPPHGWRRKLVENFEANSSRS